ncbi:MAG: hypothetical protein LBJ74_00020 [Heliobacteriaceae bacterium]|jgi:SMC interacting uncharacterized protein involved in chromosome segregation|nr:hypothetical protein [Heliobacteriaceae bacterium]
MKKEILNSIKEKELQLAKLKVHVEKSSICSELYNKVVLEKAILKKELEAMNSNVFVENIKRLLPGKKLYICDYFKK